MKLTASLPILIFAFGCGRGPDPEPKVVLPAAFAAGTNEVHWVYSATTLEAETRVVMKLDGEVVFSGRLGPWWGETSVRTLGRTPLPSGSHTLEVTNVGTRQKVVQTFVVPDTKQLVIEVDPVRIAASKFEMEFM